mmetsp:Transcript_71217/g.154781  ORF Transcript_71217/g.154781 Transcript_71217/m.154781 type:complete len:215 (+) Transcript_71217:67-711(+)
MARTSLAFGQGGLLVDALSMTVVMLSLLLLCISVLRRYLDGSLRHKSSGLSFLRRWFDENCDQASLRSTQRRRRSVGTGTAAIEASGVSAPAGTRRRPAARGSRSRLSAPVPQASKQEILAEKVEEGSSAYGLADATPICTPAPAISGIGNACSCAKDSAWGCEHHRKYSSGVLLWHRELSVKIARGPPGLERPDIVASDRKIVPGLARRGVDF